MLSQPITYPFIADPLFDFSGKTLDLSTPQVMGIINLAPDSFCQASQCETVEAAVERGVQMVQQGATLLDIGAEPTNPNLHPVLPVEIELQRIVPVVQALTQAVNVPISVDTSKPEVIEQVAKAGAAMINDVRALRQPAALQAAIETDLPVCLMHMQYPDGMPENSTPEPFDVLERVQNFFKQRIDECVAAGLNAKKIIIDPGIGAGSFGKSTDQSLQLIKHLQSLHQFGLPILVGTSRKAFIRKLLDLPIDKALAGSLASALAALANGASILRVHDVRETVEAVRVLTAITES